MTTTTQAPSINTELRDIAEASVIPNFGGGRYSKFMESVYKDLTKACKLSPFKAEKIARMAAKDAGEASKNNVIGYKVGKPNPDGKVSVREVADAVKNCAGTNALNIVHALQWAGDAGKHNVSFQLTKWTFTPSLQEWVDNLPENAPVAE